MKLLYCHDCGDIFNLDYRLKQCSCGKAKGHYVSPRDAEVNGEGTSLGMGSGSFAMAIATVWRGGVKADFRTEGGVWRRHPSSIICWARPHEGPANSHTKVNKALRNNLWKLP